MIYTVYIPVNFTLLLIYYFQIYPSSFSLSNTPDVSPVTEGEIGWLHFKFS